MKKVTTPGLRVPLDIVRGARFDDTRRYRYTLTRDWADCGIGRVLWIMLNPSTADETKEDPTIRRCIDFALQWEYDGLTICNLFALRSTDPRELKRQGGIVGPDNDRTIREEVARDGLIVAAWGNHGALFGRSTQVRELVAGMGRRLVHLGLTSAGFPRHPLYVPRITRPEPWDLGGSNAGS